MSYKRIVKYSICITNYNAKETLRQCLESVFSQIDPDFEIVISDNCSTDGSREILEEYEKNGKIKLIVEHSNRGKGRQIAFENAVGDYIISGIDTDDVIRPILKDILKLYHEKHEGYMLSFGTFHVIPRYLVNAVGGWRDLQWGEDIDFAKRVELAGKIHYFQDPSNIIEKGHLTIGLLHRLKENYLFYQCHYRMGLSVFGGISSSSWYLRPPQFFIALTALTLAKLKRLDKLEYKSELL